MLINKINNVDKCICLMVIIITPKNEVDARKLRHVELSHGCLVFERKINNEL